VELLDALDARVAVLYSLGADDLADDAGVAEEHHPNDLLAAASSRLRDVGTSVKAMASRVREEPPPPGAGAVGGRAGGAAEERGVGSRLGSGWRAFGKQITKLAHRPGEGEPQPQPQPRASSSAPSPPGQATPPRRPPPPRTSAQLARRRASDQERAVFVRERLAAFAVAAYVRSVLEPRLARRTASALSQPGSPGRAPAPAPVHAHGGSLTGSRHFEEQHLQDMDTVLEARQELDALQELAGCPLMLATPAAAAPFCAAAPALLDAATTPAAFQAAAARLLLAGASAAQVLAVLRAEENI
jgi:hypothetical protein